MSDTQLERSVLEAKERDELFAIADALGAKPAARAKKSDLITQILKATGIEPTGRDPELLPARRERVERHCDDPGGAGSDRAGHRSGARFGSQRRSRHRGGKTTAATPRRSASFLRSPAASLAGGSAEASDTATTRVRGHRRTPTRRPRRREGNAGSGCRSRDPVRGPGRS